MFKSYKQLIAEGWVWVEDQKHARVFVRLQNLKLENMSKEYRAGEPHENSSTTYVGIYERERGSDRAATWVSPPSFSPGLSMREFHNEYDCRWIEPEPVTSGPMIRRTVAA